MPFQYDQSGELIGFIQRLNSPGFIQMYGGSSAPGGWLFCDGSVVDQVDFPDLFLVIGTTYNTGGEGPGEFRLPNFRSRSPIGVGQGVGLSNYVLAQIGGEENHLLIISEMPTHTHLQNAHTHLQDAHTHIQDSHNHTQNAHTHIQDSHNHTQNPHNHTYTETLVGAAGSERFVGNGGGVGTTSNTTATNNAATATNQNTTATNNAETATNQNTTATNQNTTATNQNEGGNGSHNTLHPYLAVNFMIKY